MTAATESPAEPFLQPLHPRLPSLEPPLLDRLPASHLTLRELRDSIPFLGVHAAALLGAILVPPSLGLVALALGLWYLRILGISVAYHRYFAHRTFSTSRPFGFVLALWAVSSAQKGVLWWSGHHRNHHRFSDRAQDPHSPARRGFWWSHMGWILAHRNGRAPVEVIRDFERMPEIRWLERWQYLPAIALAVLCFALGGLPALVWGFFVSTVLLYHSTFSINSLAHVIGRRTYPTTDTSRNCWWLALLTAGEGWHNNHHYFCSSARLGFRRRQLDPGYLLIRGLQALGLVWDVRTPPERVLQEAA
ncbi:MAG: acyl-CoA desaturase [Myxococcota bacterium]